MTRDRDPTRRRGALELQVPRLQTGRPLQTYADVEQTSSRPADVHDGRDCRGEELDEEATMASRAVLGRLLESDDRRCFYLNGLPVRSGDILELRLPGDRWTSVLFQVERHQPVLHLSLGHRYERRFEVRSAHEFPACLDLAPDAAVIYDRQQQAVVRLSDQWPAELIGLSTPRWPDVEQDHWSDRAMAEHFAQVLTDANAAYECVPIRAVDRCELRWPGESGAFAARFSACPPR